MKEYYIYWWRFRWRWGSVFRLFFRRAPEVSRQSTEEVSAHLRRDIGLEDPSGVQGASLNDR
jgi:hypothetical protein